MKLKELPDLEHLYEVHISVYSLEPTKPKGEEGDEDNTEEENTVPDIAAQLVHRSLCHYLLFTSTCTRITFPILKI